MDENFITSIKKFLVFLDLISWKQGLALQDWADLMLEHVAENVGALQAGLFSADHQQGCLYLTGSYAVGRSELLHQKIAFGDGLIGLAAQKQTTISVSENIPQQFSNILMHQVVTPRQLVILPLVYNKTTYGVLEFTHPNSFSQRDLLFMEALLPNITSQLIFLMNEIHLQKLYDDLHLKNKLIESKSEILERANLTLEKQKSDISCQKEEITKQHQKLQFQKEQITSSIHYAKTIQEAILPPISVFRKYFSDAFIVFKPKDIVSGDGYFIDEVNGKILVALYDCTGHGVPGAFMSLVTYSLISEVVSKCDQKTPSVICERLHHELVTRLKQEDGSYIGGLDAALITLEKTGATSFELEFVGAKRPLWIYHAKSASMDKVDRTTRTIGLKTKSERQFESIKATVYKNDVIYLFSDGCVDQCDPERKRLGTKHFEQLVAQNAHLDLAVQKREFDRSMGSYQFSADQRDDISLIGIRL